LLDVLSRNGKEELFANQLDAAQPQATESTLILQLTKQRLNSSALAQYITRILMGWLEAGTAPLQAARKERCFGSWNCFRSA
jgi:hypothetical protein